MTHTLVLLSLLGQIGLRAVVDVSAARLELWSDDTLLGSYTVSVGTKQYPTPLGTFSITEVTWNPDWVPPPSEWAAAAKREPPGPENPMGLVKLRFAPLHYIHGTRETTALGRPASHGCVRLSNADAVAFARRVLQSSDAAIVPSIDSILQRGTTRTIRLTRPVPLTIVK